MTADKSDKSGANVLAESKPREDECFVIMPISDHPDYSIGHFLRVYEDVISPACRKSGFLPVRADDVKETNLIHLDILQRLLDSPMAVCDLSSANPNVLFELALRQAFNKPVVLVQEIDARPIFDIAPLRVTKYRKERFYDQVLVDQEAIATAIRATSQAFSKGEGINSIVQLLGLSQPAQIPSSSSEAHEIGLFQLVLSEVSQLRSDMTDFMNSLSNQELLQKSSLPMPSANSSKSQRIINNLREQESFYDLHESQLQVIENMLDNITSNLKREDSWKVEEINTYLNSILSDLIDMRQSQSFKKSQMADFLLEKAQYLQSRLENYEHSRVEVKSPITPNKNSTLNNLRDKKF